MSTWTDSTGLRPTLRRTSLPTGGNVAPKPSKPVYCPVCGAYDLAQPVLIPLSAAFVSAGASKAPKHPTEPMYAEPHISWSCSRCKYAENQDDKRK
jgi:hypothetical protein